MRPGDRVGVAALSGPVDEARLERGLDELRRLGLDPVAAANVRTRRGPLAGSDRERLAAFHELAERDDLTAVFFARGGHGSLRILGGIDWELLAGRPRAWVGYSDVTPFLLGVVARLGLVAFHGPMVAVEAARRFGAAEEHGLMGALSGRPVAELPVVGLREGRASGPLVGGCLSLLAATAGTPWQPDLRGALFFWEDRGEPLYRLDRMLLQLRDAGVLRELAGMVVGRSAVSAQRRQEAWELFADTLGSTGYPVAFHCPSGHCRPNMTLPLGAPATLDTERGRLLLG